MSHYDSPEKTAYRQDAVDFARCLVNEAGKLDGRWVEITGQTGYLTYRALMASGLIERVQFVGYDLDKAAIQENKLQEPDVEFRIGDVFKPKWNGVSVFNFDSHEAMDSPKQVQNRNNIRRFLHNNMPSVGACVVLYNVQLNSPNNRVKAKRSSYSAMLKQHNERLCDMMRYSGIIDPDFVLAEEQAALVDDPAFIGQLGKHYYVYKGRGAGTRMINAKLLVL